LDLEASSLSHGNKHFRSGNGPARQFGFLVGISEPHLIPNQVVNPLLSFFILYVHIIITLPCCSILTSISVADRPTLALLPLSAYQQCLSFVMSDPLGQLLDIITGIMYQMQYNFLLVPH